MDLGNWEVVFGEEGSSMLLSGLSVTLQLAAYAILFSTFIGISMSFVMASKSKRLKPLKYLLNALVELIRNVPILVQLAFWYFGIFSLPAIRSILNPLEQWYSTEFLAGAVTLILYRSVFIAEAVRGGLQSVPKGQFEAGLSTGLRPGQVMVFIISPQAFRISLPAVVNHYIGAMKNSSIVMVIGVQDVVFQAYTITSETFEVFIVMGATMIIFVLLCSGLGFAFRLLGDYFDRRWGFVTGNAKPVAIAADFG